MTTFEPAICLLSDSARSALALANIERLKAWAARPPEPVAAQSDYKARPMRVITMANLRLPPLPMRKAA